MEARVRAEAERFYDAGPSTLSGLGKKGFEWDLNDWRWDGDLFLATPVNAGPSECRNKRLSDSLSSGSEGADVAIAGKGKGVLEKRRRIVVVEDKELCNDGIGLLALNLGGNGNAHPVAEAGIVNLEGKNEKVSRVQGGSSSRSPCCQVEGCGAELSGSRDYHKRHKVCEMHAKASSAVVNNVLHRFCQQCSRFHLLQEFDEGKRSCRRRLAGHNRRRRKTIPDTASNVNPVIDDRATSYWLITLLRILSNSHYDSSDQAKDQDLLCHLLKSLATLAGSFDAKNLSGLLQATQDSQKLGPSAGNSPEVPNGLSPNGIPAQTLTREQPSTPKTTCATSIHGPSCRQTSHSVCVAPAAMDITTKKHLAQASCGEKIKLKEFDLNTAYTDTENYIDVNENAASPYMGNGYPNSPSCLLQDSHQSSPPQMSVNSDSTYLQSRSSSNGDTQSRTDRIVFKLFGKDPNDFPLVLRTQILDWLSHSPTDIESYIRPGCVILTIYLHQAESSWKELCHDLSSSLSRLLYISAHKFWKTGWVYVRIRHQIAFIYNGEVLFSIPRLLGSPQSFRIVSVSPIAAAISSRVNFTVKGSNLACANGRLLCAFEGMYLVQETTQNLIERGREHEGFESLSFSCSVPDAVGRGFIEVEDHGLSSSFFPFVVAEDDVCSEIRGLEYVFDAVSYDDEFQEEMNLINTRARALNFLNEMGWLLRRSQLRSTSEQLNSCSNGFPLIRFKWLLMFAMDQKWCSVLKNLLDLLFSGIIDTNGQSPDELALSECLLHNAVRKNCRSMVEFLLRYKPPNKTAKEESDDYLFGPDVPGPSNLTPLHIAATVSGAESVLDALTDDPRQFGLKAWRIARDITGFTPEDYARSGGHDSYLNLVQKKINKQLNSPDIVVDIRDPDGMGKQTDSPRYMKQAGVEMGRLRPGQQPHCNLCSQQLVRRSPIARTLLYRPAMLSMVGIAAVCVCVGLLFKGPPEVSFVFPPFRWERLSYGSM